jgi:RNA polymerase sigma factor (sigma-70 family)
MCILFCKTMNRQEQQVHFDQWLREHAALLHHVARGFASGDDSNDLMQELLLAMWKAIPAFRQGAKVSTFLYRVAHNAALLWERRRRSYRRRMEKYESLMPQETPRSCEAPPDAERLERLYAAIRQLPALDRSLILLALDGMSYREMAEIHGLSESNVGAKLTRLKQKLTTILKEDHPHEL